MLRKIVLNARNNHGVMLRLCSASAALNDGSSSTSSPHDTIYLSENCIRKMKELQSGEPEKKLLRLGVESGGCSGLKYVFDLDCKTTSEDRVFEKDEIKLVVDSVSYGFVRGSAVDYVDTLIRSAFVVAENPMAEKPCSCHHSFSAKQ